MITRAGGPSTAAAAILAALLPAREAVALRRTIGRPGHVPGGYRNTLPDPPRRRQSGLSVLCALIARGRAGRPRLPVPLVAEPAPAVAAPFAATWYGHSSVLLEVDGVRILIDPVWSDRVSPTQLVGPRRLHPVPIPLDALPPLDAVVISHDHYDHLDRTTVRALGRLQAHAVFVAPMGVGGYLRRWGIPDSRIVELEWGQAHTVAAVTLTCTEARHFSGRGLARNTTLWSSWSITGPRHRVFYAGDTGQTPALADIAAAHGPFHATVLPIGSYSGQWSHIHLTPEEAVELHGTLTADAPGALLIPVHWATFDLGTHPWSQPIDRVRIAAEKAGVPLAAPRPGERVDLTDLDVITEWWSEISHDRHR